MVGLIFFLLTIAIGGWAISKHPYITPPTHCKVHGDKLREYDHQLYCVKCNKRSFKKL